MKVFNNNDDVRKMEVELTKLESFSDDTDITFFSFPYINGIDVEFIYINKNAMFVVINPKKILTLEENIELIDSIYIRFESDLKVEKPLLDKRNLKFNLEVFSVGRESDNEMVFKTIDEIISKIKELCDIKTEEILNEKDKLLIQSNLQGLSKISADSENRNVIPDSLAAEYMILRKQILALDEEQARCTLGYKSGPTRIRGLAGSGKTIIIAYMVANLHIQYPEKSILVTFQSKSLIETIKRHVETIFRSLTKDEIIPNWSKINIMHAWGNSFYDGAYKHYCDYANIKFLDFKTAINKTSYANVFNYVVENAIEQSDKKLSLYDYVFVDEAQDFPNEMMKICLNMAKEKNIIWAYDELQEINDKSIGSLEELFGYDESGVQNITEDVIGSHDIILKKCYRSPKQVLTTAHALGFGIKRVNGLVQFFDNKKLFEEVGYEVESGYLEYGSDVCLKRTPLTSPNVIEKLGNEKELVNYEAFSEVGEEFEYIKTQILDMKEKGFENDEILIIHPDPKRSKDYLLTLREYLFKNSIESQVVDHSMSNEINFIQKGKVTLTHVYRAKGNEAPIVFAVQSHLCNMRKSNAASERNKLFTAISRSMGWVFISGIGSPMSELCDEILAIKNDNYMLKFTVPSIEKLREIKTINQVSENVQSETESFLQNKTPEEIEYIKSLLNKEY